MSFSVYLILFHFFKEKGVGLAGFFITYFYPYTKFSLISFDIMVILACFAASSNFNKYNLSLLT